MVLDSRVRGNDETKLHSGTLQVDPECRRRTAPFWEIGSGSFRKRTSLASLVLVAALVAGCTNTQSSTRAARLGGGSSAPAVVAATPTVADAEARFQEALGWMKAGRRDEAQATFAALAKQFPNLSGPATNLGILYAQARQRDAAIAAFNQAVSANPQNAVAYNWLGSLYREAGDFVRAEQAYRRALGLRRDYAEAMLNLAILYDVSLRRPTEAVAMYRQYQQLKGDAAPVVTAWIRELEGGATQAVAAAGVVP